MSEVYCCKDVLVECDEICVSQICSVGWEPNPVHAPYLGELEAQLRQCGHQVTINTNTGVGLANTRASFARMSQVSLR